MKIVWAPLSPVRLKTKRTFFVRPPCYCFRVYKQIAVAELHVQPYCSSIGASDAHRVRHVKTAFRVDTSASISDVVKVGQ
jgi:hypothetical protein